MHPAICCYQITDSWEYKPLFGTDKCVALKEQRQEMLRVSGQKEENMSLKLLSVMNF